MKTRNIWIWIVLASIWYYGCSDMNSLHDQYLQRGETTYMGPPDSVKIFSGDSKVVISYRNYDPKVGKLTAYWDFRQSSRTFDVPADKLGEELEVTIDQLEEKSYTFELVTSNREGKFSSIPVSVLATVYGQRFVASITNRKISRATFFPGKNSRTIYWVGQIETMISVELKYRNLSDTETVVKVSRNETNTRFADAKEDIMYRTLHSPENSVDTFYTEFVSIPNGNFVVIEEEKLDRALFRRWNPPAIPYRALGGWEIESLWDGLLGDVNPGFSSPAGTPVPWSFTFDLGQLTAFTKIKLYPRLTAAQEYVQSHPKKITIWGSPTPDVDASFDSWIYLGEFNSIKPSGLPAGQVSQEDTDYARAGEVFLVTDNIDVPVRYMRFHVLETWVQPNTTIQLMELEFFRDPE